MSNDNKNKAGWDIGGAHIKLALLIENHLQVFQWYCPLWLGIAELDKTLQTALEKMKGRSFHHSVTMTGELADCFSSKADGVQQIVNKFTEVMTNQESIQFFTKNQRLNAAQAIQLFEQTASANWLASGIAVARVCEDALFVDMGSTTTDLLIIKAGHVQNFATSDFGRLRTGELVYTGVVRTCVNTICSNMLYKSEMIPMMAEYFANTADVYRILDMLPTHADVGDTCDGGAKDVPSSVKRLARMIGLDVTDINQDEKQQWKTCAAYIAEQQKIMLSQQVQRFFNEYQCVEKIVGAGVGRFLIKQLALQLSVEYIDFSDLVLGDSIQYEPHAADCAPAVSLAMS